MEKLCRCVGLCLGIEPGESNSSASFARVRKDIIKLLDFIEKLKNEEDSITLNMDQVEKLKFKLAFIWTFVQLFYSNLDGFVNTMSHELLMIQYFVVHPLSKDDILVRYNMDRVISRLERNFTCFISSQRLHNSSATMTEGQLVELLDSLLVNIHELPTRYTHKIYPFMTQCEVLQNVCSNIRDFHELKVNGCIEHEIVKDVISQIQLVAERVGLLWFMIWRYTLGGERNVDEAKLYANLAQLFVKIIPVALEVMHICCENLKASKSTEVELIIKQLQEAFPVILSEYLVHLQEHMVNVSITASSSARNIHIMIEFLLIILTDIPKDFIHHDKLFDLLGCVGAHIKEISILVRNLEANSRNEENNNGTSCENLDLLETIELLKGKLKHVYLKAPGDSFQLGFPVSDASLYLHLLFRNLNDLLNSNAYSVALIKDEIAMVKKDLEFMRSFFGKVEQELHKDLWARVLAMAYEANDAIDSILVRDNGLLHLIFSLPNSMEKIKRAKEEVSNLQENIPKNTGLIAVKSSNKKKSNSLTASQIIVGFEEETDWITRKLTGGKADLDVISIIGVGGSGKTTLAYKVYNDKSVASHFDVCAWCTVDQEYDRKKLLQKLFQQITGSDQKFNEDFDVDDELRRKLYGRRYLIVLDDLWDIAAWDDLTRPFPKVESGSRIILTSRENAVAFHAHSDPLNLRSLRPEESWELMEKRVFGEESCPVELLDVGKEIAENCRGSPLVADLISGIIARKEKKKTLWLEILDNLISFTFENEVEVTKVIQLSYDHLPDHVKLCLLYLASFPKDEEIEVSELKALWCAEGLVEQIEKKNVEDVMEVYLDNLVSSSLVIVSTENGLKCKIHDIVHGFCLEKTRKEKLFDLISSSVSSSDFLPRQLTVDYDPWHFLLHRGWCGNFFLFDSKEKRHLGKHLLSLKITGSQDLDIYHLREFRLLRVLNLATVYPTRYLLNEIGLLIHLRYLNIKINVSAAVPLSLSSLWNLETLVVNNSNSTMVLLPRIWNLAKLRRLTIVDCSFFELDTDEPILLAEDSMLENLRMLKKLKLSYSRDTQDIFKRFPNLQELDCRITESWDCSAECNWFPQLDVLNELEVLRAGFDCDSPSASHPCDFHFPSSLKILLLSQFHLTSDSLSTIARLHNLEELCLLETTIQGEEWNMWNDTFENLKVLALSDVPLSKWEAGEESLPVLEKLLLTRFSDELKEIPPSFGDIASLKTIQLIDSPHLEDSARQIKEYVEDITGEDKLQVIVL